MSSLFDAPPRDLVDFLTRNAQIGTTDRYRQANLAEQWYQSLQYDGLLNHDAEGAASKKKPREIFPFFKIAIDTLLSFVWGGSRAPRVSISATRADTDTASPGEVGPRLYTKDAEQLSTFVTAMMKAARLDRCVSEYSRNALITSSCAVLLGSRAGWLTYYVEHGKHCTPFWSKLNPRALESLEIRYQYSVEEPVPMSTQTRTRWYWFRRVLDEQNDTVFQKIPVTPGALPEWIVDTDKSVVHGLGFCPAVWVRTLPISADAVDGQPVIDPVLYKILDRLNRIYSQRGRAIEYVLDPQWIRKNVTPEQRQLLQRNPGKIWDLDDASPEKRSSIELMEARGTGSDAAGAHLVDLRNRFLEACRVVIADTSQAPGGQLSGVVLEYLNAPMIALASDLRKDLGDDALGDLINMGLRMACALDDQGMTLFIPGIAKACALMKKAQLAGPWLDFPVNLSWGRYFTPTTADVAASIASATAAQAGGLISKITATKYVADLFNVLDTQAELDQIDTETPDPPPVVVAAPGAPGAPPPAPVPPGKAKKQASQQPPQKRAATNRVGAPKA